MTFRAPVTGTQRLFVDAYDLEWGLERVSSQEKEEKKKRRRKIQRVINGKLAR